MEEKRKPNVRKSVIIAVMVCSLILVGFLGSYAFFISQVGQNKNQSVSVQAGTMALTFSDGNNGFSKELDFGQSAEKAFTIENTGTEDGVVSMSFMNLINTYLESSMTYTLEEADSLDGEYTKVVDNKNVPNNPEAGDRVLAAGLTIPAGATKYYKLTLSLNYTDFDQTEDLNAKLETQFKITEGILKDPTLSEITLAKLGKKAKEGNPNFALAATTDETKDGLYSMADDYGTSYYYRGNVEDNYVKFAGFYWRIIRVNGDGSLRIIYDGTSAHANIELTTDRLALQNVAWNTSNINDAKYVGYMYAPAGTVASTSKEEAQTNLVSSDIKTAVEAWYKTNIRDKGYDEYVSDNIFCNDRNIPGKGTTELSNDTGLGYGKNVTAYQGYKKFATNQDNPISDLTCNNKNDAFTKEDTEKGNGALDEKIGLITADEINLAGSGKGGTTNQNYYLYKGSWYWSLSPAHLNGIYAYMFRVTNDGSLRSSDVNSTNGVAPVISLTPEYVNTLIGDGTMSNPFREKTI